MDELEKKHFKIFTKLAFRKPDDEMGRYKWNATEDEFQEIDKQIIKLVPKNASVLEVGCGNGRFAKRLLEARDDIKYQGFDIVKQNVRDAQKRLPSQLFYRANYWEVLTTPDILGFDYVISQGVLFTCTNPKYKDLLLELLNNSATKGFFVMCIAMLKPRKAEIQKVYSKSKGVIDSNRCVSMPSRLINTAFWISRAGVIDRKIPKIPKYLKSMPESEAYNKIFTIVPCKECHEHPCTCQRRRHGTT